MIRFNNDYNHGAHPEVLKAFLETNSEQYAGYSEDEWCKKASDLIRKITDCKNADVYFFPGATQANFIVISSFIGSCESVICADTGHINMHECASVENTGRKIIALPNKDGKISAIQIQKEAEKFYEAKEAEYLTRPSLVYISFTTEYGTLYSKEELTEISKVCKKYNMSLFVDGARMGYGLGAEENNLTLKDFAALTDVFYIGGTKCGAMFGEAVVIPHPSSTTRFKSHMKQNGAVLAKGWCLGLQFYTLLKDGLYFEITKQADKYAMQIRDAFRKMKIPEYIISDTNQQFVILTNEQAKKLATDFIFEKESTIDDNHQCVRFCTSWSTTQAEIDALVKSILSI